MRVDRFRCKLLLTTCTVLFLIWYFARPNTLEQTEDDKVLAYFSGSVDQLNDVHVRKSEISNRRRRTDYPPRKDMGECPKIFGKVIVFVAYVNSSMQTHYRVAQESLQCYLKTTNYTVAMVDLDNDLRVQHACGKNKQLFFKKHCAASVYLQDADWMLVLDADTGIANPNHCIEEWIDDRVDLVFYERFFNFEIASGNYLVRNSEFSLNFLKKWADWEFNQPTWSGADNGALQLHILQTVIPEATQEIQNCDTIWHNATGFESYMGYVNCVKLTIGATRIWPGKLRIYRRAHGWVRDGYLTNDCFCDLDFMFHGWKSQDVADNGWQSPFSKRIDPAKCGKGLEGWDYRPDKKKTCTEIRKILAEGELGAGKGFPSVARVIPHLQAPDIGLCFPECDKNT